MAGLLMLAAYLLTGVVCANAVLGDKSPLLRGWLGLSFGMLLFMWLPALAAFFVRFTLAAEFIALGLLSALAVGVRLWWRKKFFSPSSGSALAPDSSPGRKRPWPSWRLNRADKRMLLALALFALPLTILSAYLQHTHTLREVDGALHVGQSTYGDLSMHLSIATSLRGSALPAEYSILPGTALGYPILTDAMSTSLLLLGVPLRWSLILPGILMSGLVYAGYLLLAREMTGKTSAAVLAGALLFLNGGLGFLYTFDLAGNDFSRIGEVFTGFYKTPANQPDLNLRWSNLVADLLLPQRTFLGGWTLLLPGLYFAREAFANRERRMFLLAALFGAAMPLVHTHSFLALALYSAGALLYAYLVRKEGRRALVTNAALYLGIVAVLALPQLMAFTFRQVGREGFMRLHFNWVNNGESGFVDLYPWFWLKNVGLPLIAMLCALLNWRKRDRMDCVGAALIFAVAELILFQPLDYDNNKLFYVWYLLMLPMAACWCVSLWQRLMGQRGRTLLAALFLAGSTLSGALSIAREVVSDYQIFSPAEVKAAAFIEENTDPDAVFLTGMHHNNPVYALAGRKVVCGPSLFLYWHGLDYLNQARDVSRFYADPASNLDVLTKHDVSYVVVGWPERLDLSAEDEAMGALFPVAYSGDGFTIYRVR